MYDVQTGIMLSANFFSAVSFNLKSGYRIINNDYNNFDGFAGRYKQSGIFIGLELSTPTSIAN